MDNIIQKSLFLYEPNIRTLALIDLGATKSGEIMQNIGFVQPKIIEKLQEYVNIHKPEIGEIVHIQDYSFFIVRKHYNTRFKEEEFKKIINNLDMNYTYKTTYEVSKTMKPFLDYLLKNSSAHILVYESSNWKDRNLGLEEKNGI